jgi:hypothetical protein
MDLSRSHVSSQLNQKPFHPLQKKKMVVQEIEKAKAFYSAYGSVLRGDEGVQGLLDDYRKAIAHTYEAMAEGGVMRACSQCAQSPAGSCCFEGVEDWYDPVLLLINLLLDVSLPSRREISKACFFVGQAGCKLLGRYAFCVNFLCPRLNAGREDGKLLRAAGEELFCGWELEKAIRRRINLGAGQAVPVQEVRP